MLTFAILACLAIYSAVQIPDRGTRRRRVVAAPVRSGQQGAHREVLTAAQHPGLVASQVLHSVAAADSADCELVLDERVAPLPTPTITEQQPMKDTRSIVCNRQQGEERTTCQRLTIPCTACVLPWKRIAGIISDDRPETKGQARARMSTLEGGATSNRRRQPPMVLPGLTPL